MKEMETVEKAVKDVLPALAEPLLRAVAVKLVESGVETTDDLQFVEGKDLDTLLKPIQYRKLMHAWAAKGKLVLC